MATLKQPLNNLTTSGEKLLLSGYASGTLGDLLSKSGVSLLPNVAAIKPPPPIVPPTSAASTLPGAGSGLGGTSTGVIPSKQVAPTTMGVGAINDTGKVTVPPPSITQSSASKIYDSSVYLNNKPKTFTLPNGAIVDQEGKILSPAPVQTTVPDTTGPMNTISSLVTKLTDVLTNRPSVQNEFNKMADERLAKFDALISGAEERARSIREQYTSVDLEEKNALEAIYGQGTGAPLAILDNKAAKVQRQYENRKANLSALLGVEMATIESINGRADRAQSILKDSLAAFTYDIDSQISDLNTLISTNKSIYETLSDERRTAIAQQQNDLAQQREQRQQEFDNFIKLQNLNIQSAQEERLSRGIDELSAVDLQRLKEIYPNVDFTKSLSPAIQSMIEESKKPKDFSSADVTLMAVQQKAQGAKYADLVKQIDTDPLVNNKEEVKQWIGQVYGKEPADTNTTQTINDAFDAWMDLPTR